MNFSAEVPEGTQCQWDFGTGIFETQATDEKCNPGYVKFPENTDVILILHDPNYPENSITKIVRVSRSKEEKTSLLVPRITLQTKITSSKKITSTGIICEITGDTCSLNFTAAESVGATLWYWDF